MLFHYVVHREDFPLEMSDLLGVKPITTTTTQAIDSETSIVENSMTVSLGKPLPSNFALDHSDMTQSTVTMKVVTENNEASPFESNAIYILSAVGAVVVVVLAIAILLSIIFICKHRERIFKGKLKRSNTSQSSNASDFVYNSTYQWTCRHMRLLPHLRPDTTNYQSHWSLTRDHTKSQSKTSSNCPSPPQPHVHNDDNLQPDGPTCHNHTTITCELSTNDADNTEPQGECILIEDRISCTETNGSLEIQECNREQSSPIASSSVKMSTHAEKPSKEQEKKEDSVCVEIHGNGMAADNCNMYSNPLYTKKREVLKMAEEESWNRTEEGKEEREREGEGEGEGKSEEWEEGKEGEREEEREEEREDLGEVEELEEDHISIAYYSISKKPPSSFVISDDEKEEEREEREREREKQEQKWDKEQDLEEDRALSIYYSIPKKPFSSFIFSDSDTYDSGNASTISTDLSTQLSTTQTPYYTFRAYAGTPAVKEKGLVESNSFEFTDSITYGTILKKGSGYLL